jgi:Fe-S oxidoreductase
VTEKAPVNVDAAVERFAALTGAHVAAYLDSCVHCGQCAEACHFYEVTKDPRYTPAYKLRPLTKAYQRAKSPWAKVRRALSFPAQPVTAADLREWEELLFDSCTLCGRCTVVCPMGIDIASLVAITRQGMVASGLGPADLLEAADRSRDQGSALGVSPDMMRERIEWLVDEFEVDIPLDKPQADVMLTVSSIETMKYPKSVVAMAKILNHAGENWMISSVGYEATNFGVLSGKADVAKIMLGRIVEGAENVGAKLVIVPECGHAYGALRWSGASLLGRLLPFEVLHITEYLARLKREGRLTLKPFARPVTYHDPCQISRRGGATQAARALLAEFAEDFREMEPTGDANWCCGGGGGVAAIARAAELRHKVFRIKIDQVEKTGAESLVSSCSNCRLTFDDSKAACGWPRPIESLTEIIADHLAD